MVKIFSGTGMMVDDVPDLEECIRNVLSHEPDIIESTTLDTDYPGMRYLWPRSRGHNDILYHACRGLRVVLFPDRSCSSDLFA